MPSPYSNDFRRKLVEAVAQGTSCRQVAERFDVSPSWVLELMQRYRATGDVAPARFGGLEKSVLLAHEQDIQGWIAADSDLTIAAIGERLATCGAETSRAAICRYLQKLGPTRKKGHLCRRAIT